MSIKINIDNAYIYSKKSSNEELYRLTEDEKVNLIRCLVWKLDELKKENSFLYNEEEGNENE